MNLQNTLEYIASVAQNHPLINSSYVGSIYDLNSNTNTKYAVFAVEDIDVTKQNNTLLYNCYLYVVDRVMNDESNTIAVQTMAVNTLQEIINYIEVYSQSLEVYGSYIITPIRQKFSDECAGAYVQLRLVSQNDIGDCAFSDDKVVEIFQGKTYLLDNYFTKSETLTLLDGKQNTLTAGKNIDITDDVISVPQEVYLSSIFSPEGTIGSVLSFSARTQTADYTTLSAAGASAESNIELMGAGNDNEASSIGINAYGYSDANMQLCGGGETRSSQVEINASGYSDGTIFITGGTENDKKSSIMLTANGTEYSEIQIVGGDDNEASSIGINAYGYSDANMQLYGGGETRRSYVSINAAGFSDSTINMRGGTENEKKSEIIITANGTEYSEIQIVGGDDNNHSYVNIDSEKFTYKDNDVAVKPINSTFVSGNTIVLTDNYIYDGTNITSLTINGTNFTGDCLIQFTTGSTSPNITINGLIFDVLPTFNSNKYYELGVHNGHCLWVEYDS